MLDFAIIGGGIAGISTAARLAPHGSTVLLEAEDNLGHHASGRSAALYEPNYGSPSTIALNHASLPDLNDADVLTSRGVMLIGRAGEDAAFQRDCKAFDLRTLSVADALAFWPILDTKVVKHAAFSAVPRDIDTDRLMTAYARAARTSGAEVRTCHAVTAITRIPTGWQIEAGGLVLTARTLVNAAGAWADQVAKLAGITPLGLVPKRRSMARVPAPAGHAVAHWPMIFGPGENWYAKPDAGALLISPADEAPVDPHDAYANDLTLAEGIDRFQAHMTYAPARLLASWAGLRTFAPDGSLVLGRSQDDPDFIWCAGQGGYGMQSAPAASQLIADILTEQPSGLDAGTRAQLSPARFSN